MPTLVEIYFYPFWTRVRLPPSPPKKRTHFVFSFLVFDWCSWGEPQGSSLVRFERERAEAGEFCVVLKTQKHNSKLPLNASEQDTPTVSTIDFNTYLYIRWESHPAGSYLSQNDYQSFCSAESPSPPKKRTHFVFSFLVFDWCSWGEPQGSSLVRFERERAKL